MPTAPKKAYPLRIEPSLWEALERCAAAEFPRVYEHDEQLQPEALGPRGV